MLSAKFFAALAVLQLGFALLAARAANQSLDVYFHATYFVIAPIHLQILLAISSACFALIYFAAFRWLPHPLSNSLGLTHFVLATIAFVLLSGGCLCSRQTRQQMAYHWSHHQVRGRFSRLR